jgi:hypothetical protein
MRPWKFPVQERHVVDDVSTVIGALVKRHARERSSILTMGKHKVALRRANE